MPTQLISDNLWPTLTRAIRSSKRPCQVAVAYLGQGAAKMLPLPKGSRLVVDASERTVKLGLTCPAELLKLHKKGVEVFSVMNLHAKVYVTGSNAFIGSANASQHSAGTLIETLLQTTEPQAVKQSRQFVETLCLQSLGPEQLKALVNIYRPPNLPGGRPGKHPVPKKTVKPELAEVYLAQLDQDGPWPDDEEELRDSGWTTAKRVRKHRANTHEVEEFRWAGNCGFRQGQQVIQILGEQNGETWVYPPGHVLHVRKHPKKNVSYVYVEYPDRRRKSLKNLASKLGRGALTKLRRNGSVKNQDFAHALLKAWNAGTDSGK
jgi:hypothetical protein